MDESKKIRIKKKFGQHFLRDTNIVRDIVENVEITDETSIFEIGCGGGLF